MPPVGRPAGEIDDVGGRSDRGPLRDRSQRHAIGWSNVDLGDPSGDAATVQIDSPAKDTTITEGNGLDLAATAADDEDGDDTVASSTRRLG